MSGVDHRKIWTSSQNAWSELRKGLAEDLPVEERLLHRVPTRRSRDEHDQRRDDDGRARTRDGDPSAPASALVALAPGEGRHAANAHSAGMIGATSPISSQVSVIVPSSPDSVSAVIAASTQGLSGLSFSSTKPSSSP